MPMLTWELWLARDLVAQHHLHSYKNFRVKSPDPHKFDRDKDGIGCESESSLQLATCKRITVLLSVRLQFISQKIASGSFYKGITSRGNQAKFR
jgi:hypothetical protein